MNRMTAKAAATADVPKFQTPGGTERLTVDQVRELVRVGDGAILAEVLARFQGMAAEEAARSTRLDQKASGLMAAIGVSTVVALGKGDLSSLPKWALGVSTAAAGIALCLALSVLWVSTYLRTDERAVFSARQLLEDSKTADEGMLRYQRSMLIAYWESLRPTVDANQARALRLRNAQAAFAGAVLLILGCGCWHCFTS